MAEQKKKTLAVWKLDDWQRDGLSPRPEESVDGFLVSLDGLEPGHSEHLIRISRTLDGELAVDGMIGSFDVRIFTRKAENFRCAAVSRMVLKGGAA